MILCDTNVMIEYLKSDPRTVARVNKIGFPNIALSSITMMELSVGALNKNELRKIQKSLRPLPLLHIDNEISETALQLIEKYSKSHNLQIPDALIAATAIANNFKLLTYNLKDFQYIEGLQLEAVNKG
ncbi:MAG: type II toxin-antitoxin system VapC family toxin [Candidatus Wallbacteria bacterium]|nr:type II toxin-antitoxin system VapC family toxin [Candidatus Wallbacteria bacterium]